MSIIVNVFVKENVFINLLIMTLWLPFKYMVFFFIKNIVQILYIYIYFLQKSSSKVSHFEVNSLHIWSHDPKC